MPTTKSSTTGYEGWKDLQLNFDAREMFRRIVYEYV